MKYVYTFYEYDIIIKYPRGVYRVHKNFFTFYFLQREVTLVVVNF